MPKTTMDKDHLLLRRKDQIRLAGQICEVQSVSVPGPVDQSTHEHLWLGVPIPN
jgi:hypothetical protein